VIGGLSIHHSPITHSLPAGARERRGLQCS